MGVPVEESTADAVLLIGDRAMTVASGPFHAVVDLAQAWQELTGEPFEIRYVSPAGRREQSKAQSTSKGDKK